MPHNVCMSNPYDNNPYTQQQGYVQSSPYGTSMAQPHPQGTMILVLGILSIVGISILGPFAMVMGNKAIKEIDANPGAYSNRDSVNIGRILGIIGTVLLALGVVAMVIWLVFVFVIIGISASSGY